MNEEETLLDEFESAWLAGNPMSIEEFLDSHSKNHRRTKNHQSPGNSDSPTEASSRHESESLVAELVRLEFEYRYRQTPDSPPSVQEYVERYPSIDLASALSEDEERLIRRFGGVADDDPLDTIVTPSGDGSLPHRQMA